MKGHRFRELLPGLILLLCALPYSKPASPKSASWSERAMAARTIRLTRERAEGREHVLAATYDTLISSLSSETDPFIRSEITAALMPDLAPHDPDSLSVLRRLFADPNPYIRKKAIDHCIDDVYETFIPPGAVEAAASLLYDTDVMVRVAAMQILEVLLPETGKTAPPYAARSFIIEDLENPDPAIRLAAARLIRLNSREADQELRTKANQIAKEADALLKKWNDAVSANTTKAYEKFVRKSPHHFHAEDAKRRIENPDYGFLQTVSMMLNNPAHASFVADGFRKSHRDSPHLGLLDQLRDYLGIKDLRDVRKFLSKHPGSLLEAAARCRSPLLMLAHAGGEAVIRARLGQTLDRSASGSGVPKTVWMKTLMDIQKKYAGEGVTIHISNLNTLEYPPGDFRFLIEVNYSEAAAFATDERMSVFKSIYNPISVQSALDIVERSTGHIWSTGLELDQVSGPFDSVPLLDETAAAARFLLTLNHVDFSDQKQAWEALSQVRSLFPVPTRR